MRSWFQSMAGRRCWFMAVDFLVCFWLRARRTLPSCHQEGLQSIIIRRKLQGGHQKDPDMPPLCRSSRLWWDRNSRILTLIAILCLFFSSRLHIHWLIWFLRLGFFFLDNPGLKACAEGKICFPIRQFINNNAKIKFNKEAKQLFTMCTLTSIMVGRCFPSPDRMNYGCLWCYW